MLTSLLLVCLLIMPGAFWPGAAQQQGPPRCLSFGVCELITCNPDGSYTYTFQITNVSSFAATAAEFRLLNPASAVIAPNPYPLTPALLPGQSRQITVTISGVGPGSLCFAISVHDANNLNCCSEIDKCITLPSCGAATPTAACAAGICCARAPKYVNSNITGQKMAAMTGWSQKEVLTVFDMSGANAFLTNANNTPAKYNGPPGSPWTMANLGSIFGLTIDHLGNIYVTASSAYNGDVYPQGPGRIYKIADGTGAISNFNAVPLPNSPDPAIVAAGRPSDAFPALGNISFDCGHKQFFVTNEDDGRIYRLDTLGTVVSTFDHATGIRTGNGNPEIGDQPGFAPLGERLWAVQVHNNRVYYSVWKEDCGNRNSNPAIKNEIWSVGINVAGDFNTSDKRLELTVPDLSGADFSNPTSDISFSRDGRLLLAERTMGCSSASSCGGPALAATTVNAHASRVLEYTCEPSGWRLVAPISGSLYKYNIGIAASSACPVMTAQPANAAGGIDYDYDPSAAYGMWATGDALKFSPLIYGLQGVPFAGGTVTNSALVDWLGLLQGDKTRIGDVEVSCPPGASTY
jgi:hypothetical protein